MSKSNERAELIQFLNDHTIGGSEFNRKMARAAALLAEDKADGEVVRYEYRWLNPANNPDEPTSATEWTLVEPRNSYVDTVEDRIRELESYRYDGKPVYEVRALYTHPHPQPQPSVLPDDVVKDAERYRFLRDKWDAEPASAEFYPCIRLYNLTGEADDAFCNEQKLDAAIDAAMLKEETDGSL